jgi:hypothetical protein
VSGEPLALDGINGAQREGDLRIHVSQGNAVSLAIALHAVATADPTVSEEGPPIPFAFGRKPLLASPATWAVAVVLLAAAVLRRGRGRPPTPL